MNPVEWIIAVGKHVECRVERSYSIHFLNVFSFSSHVFKYAKKYKYFKQILQLERREHSFKHLHCFIKIVV